MRLRIPARCCFWVLLPQGAVVQGADSGCCSVLSEVAAAGRDSDLRRVLLQGAAAECCCRVLLQVLQVKTRSWAGVLLLVAGCSCSVLLQGAAAGRDSTWCCCSARCIGMGIFSSLADNTFLLSGVYTGKVKWQPTNSESTTKQLKYIH